MGYWLEYRYSFLDITIGEKVKAAYKIWLDNNGKAFGEGPYELLKRVEKTNSLHEAAHQMDMSYSKAWKLIQTMEKRLGFSLLDKKIGGLSGGGSRVSPIAMDLMSRYERFRKDVKETIEEIYQRHFGSIEREFKNLQRKNLTERGN
jgi:molybdate transport system regulatory protein